MSLISRRALLCGAIGLVPALWYWRHVGPTQGFRAVRFQGGGFSPKYQNRSLTSSAELQPYAFRVYSNGDGFETIKTTTAPHCVYSIPNIADQSIAISRRGPHASLIDWEKGIEAKVLSLNSGEFFYGHGLFMKDGSKTDNSCYLSVGRYVEAKSLGTITRSDILKIDCKSMTVIERYELSNVFTHDILDLTSNELVIGLGGSHNQGASLGIYDLQSKQIERLPSLFAVDYHRGIAHFVRCSPSMSVWSSNSFRHSKHVAAALIFFNHVNFDMEKYEFEGELARSELLSMEYHLSTGNLWMTFPDVNKVVVFNINKRKIVKVLPFRTSVTYVGINEPSESPVILGGYHGFTMWNPTTFELVNEVIFPDEISKRSLHMVAHLRWS